jgi:hypothetical protein
MHSISLKRPLVAAAVALAVAVIAAGPANARPLADSGPLPPIFTSTQGKRPAPAPVNGQKVSLTGQRKPRPTGPPEPSVNSAAVPSPVPPAASVTGERKKKPAPVPVVNSPALQ